MKLANKFFVIVACMFTNATVYAMDRIIVKYKPSEKQNYNVNIGKMTRTALNKELQKPYSRARLNTLTKIANHKIHDISTIATGAHVLKIDGVSSTEELDEIVTRLNKESDIEYAMVDKIMQPTGIANPRQWYLMGIESNLNVFGHITHGDNILRANNWLESNGISQQSVVVAVIDTGYTPHPDFLGQLIHTAPNKYGYSFISDCRVSGECSVSNRTHYNIAYKVDGLDLGDYLTAEEISSSNGYFDECKIRSSSWHGTHIIGIIAGNGYDSVQDKGVLGGASKVKILPLRVLGKCGGYVSDMANAMLWAAGETNVSNNAGGTLPPNPTPADVFNLSLGAKSGCSSLEQDVINIITANGTNGKIVVVSAGNASSDVQNYSPANCNHVIKVGAKGSDNRLSFYSNWGDVDIVASGGDSRISNGFIYSTSWSGNGLFDASMQPGYRNLQGTSMAAPNVSSSIANLIAYFKHTNKSWNNASIRSILLLSANDLANPCSSSGKCVKIKSALDANNALAYAVNFYSSSLDLITTIPDLFAGETFSLKFKNNGATLESGISTISLSGLSGSQNVINMLQNNCDYVHAGDECEVILQLNEAFSGEVYFNDIHGISLAAVDVKVFDSKLGSSMSLASSGSRGGGGCTMIENGDDYGLIVLTLLVGVYVFTRKYFAKSVE